MRSNGFVAGLLVLFPLAAPAEENLNGQNARIPFQESRVIGSPDPISPYKMVRAFPNLVVKQPLALFPEPGTDRLFLLHHLGGWSGPTRLLALKDDQEVSETEQLIEVRGLAIGFTFHPDYEKNGYVYLGLNDSRQGRPKTTQVVRYTVDRKPPYRVDPKSETLIIEWPSNGHDGGDVTFGNDGYLYVSSGDGSSDSDANLTGQSLNDLLACVLRIDVDHPAEGKAYSIPKDNPFVSRPGACGEVWAYGLRNPWRLSYDKTSGQLWVGQNGQDLWEQVYLIKKGGNYGWSLFEGSHIFHSQRQAGPDPILPPTAEHSHSDARSLTGGRVYRGPSVPSLTGVYVYGDWSTGRVWGVKHNGEQAEWHKELVDTPFNITGFGIDHKQEMYVIDHAGAFYRFTPTTEADKPTQPFPTKLSQTGLFASVAQHKPVDSALLFEVAAPQWADGATMERFAGITQLEKIQQKPQLNAGGSWTLPNGSVLVQTLSLNLASEDGQPKRTRIETRLLTRQQGEWVGYSYRWNPEQTDAELVASKGTAAAYDVADSSSAEGRREQIWRFPSRAECMSCHSRASGFHLAFNPLQLNTESRINGTVQNQLQAFENIGLFEGKLPAARQNDRHLVNPYDEKAPLESRVRSYFHVNCSTCHVKEGGGNAKMQMSISSSTRQMELIDVNPLHARFDLPDAKIVAAGAPERSVLHYRMTHRDTSQMPPLVSTEVDHQAVKLITEWIRGLPPTGRK